MTTFARTFPLIQSSRTSSILNVCVCLARRMLPGGGARSKKKNCPTFCDCFKYYMPAADSAAGQSSPHTLPRGSNNPSLFLTFFLRKQKRFRVVEPWPKANKYKYIVPIHKHIYEAQEKY